MLPAQLASHKPRRVLAARLTALALTAAIIVTVASPMGQPSAAASEKVALFDTAWELPFLASDEEAVSYFDHLAQVGFEGTWISLFDILTGAATATDRGGNVAFTMTSDGYFTLDDNYVAGVRRKLDAAQQRGLKVTIVPVWGVVYLHHKSYQGCGGSNQGLLQEYNAWDLGRQIGEAFGDHPAINSWLLGGDNYCGRESAQIWSNLTAGLQSAGADQSRGYHSSAEPNRHLDYMNEWWVDYLAVQTGHCQGTDATRFQLSQAQQHATKPVVAAELRYEGIAPAWDCPAHGVHNPVDADDVESDIRAATELGFTTVAFGHNERWQWGLGVHGSSGGGASTALATLGSAGEQRALAITGAVPRQVLQSPPSPPETPSDGIESPAGQPGAAQPESIDNAGVAGGRDVSISGRPDVSERVRRCLRQRRCRAESIKRSIRSTRQR